MKKRKLTRRDFLRLSAMTAAGVVAAACAPATPQIVEVEKEVPVEKEVVRTVVVEKEKVITPVPGPPVTITFWHHWGGKRIPLMEAMINDFQDRHPGIKVEMTLQPWDRRLEKILTAVASGTAPDVTMLGRQDVPQFVENNALIPLDALMARDGVSRDDYYTSEIDACYYRNQCWILPLPTSGATGLVYYNKGLFEEAGLPSAPEDMPETWTELEEVAAKLTKVEGGKVKKLGIGMHFISWDAGFLTWLYNNRGAWLSEDGRKATFNSEAGYETIEWMWHFLNDIIGGREAVEGWVEPGVNPFFAGLQAMQLSGVWQWYIIKQNAPDIDLGIFLCPHSDDGDYKFPMFAGWGYVIPKGTKHVDEAWELVKWLTWEEEGKSACWFMFEQFRPSPKKSCNENPAYYEKHPQWAMVLKSLEKGVTPPLLPTNAEMKKILDDNLQRIYLGEVEPRQGLDEAAVQIQQVLDDYWAKVK